jgi:cellulose synthase/poly-beta-1,6-N-acetylglucosamine synthase-like glycosyltransferase
MILVKVILLLYLLKIGGYLILSLISKKIDVFNNANVFPQPSVDIILPMFNEEKVIVKTVKNLLNIKYKYLGIIIIDDGSTDGSLHVVNNHFKGHPRIKIIHQENSGKANALNAAILESESEIVVCIDADTMVRRNVMDEILPFFLDKKVAAVAGHVVVGNKINLITNTQYVEYITNQNFERSVFESINGIVAIPGAIGAFRRSIVTEVGGYTQHMLTEDSDLTLKIHSRNYVIKNAPDAIGFTEAPASLKDFFSQRVRWKVGLIQVLLKYRKNLLLHPNKSLAYITIPYNWLFNVLLPLVIPIVDYFLIYDMLFTTQHVMLPYYLCFIFIDAIMCIYILWRKKESTRYMVYIIFQRFILRHIIQLSYLFILFKYLKGTLHDWGKIKRYASVKLD